MKRVKFFIEFITQSIKDKGNLRENWNDFIIKCYFAYNKKVKKSFR